MANIKDNLETFKLGDKFISASTFDFLIQDYKTGEVLALIDYATNVAINTEYDETELRGGALHRVLAKLYHTPVAQFTSELPLLDPKILNVKSGAQIRSKGSRNSFYKVFSVDRESAKVEIPFEPIANTLKINRVTEDGGLLNEIKVGSPSTKEDEYSIEGKVITLNDTLKAESVVIVFDYVTGDKSQVIKMLSGGLPKYVRITAKSLVQSSDGSEPEVLNLIIPKAQPNPDFSMDTTTGDPSSIPFNCEVFSVINDEGEHEFYRFALDEEMGNTISGDYQGSILG